MPKKSGKNRFSDAHRLKPILYSCSSLRPTRTISAVWPTKSK